MGFIMCSWNLKHPFIKGWRSIGWWFPNLRKWLEITKHPFKTGWVLGFQGFDMEKPLDKETLSRFSLVLFCWKSKTMGSCQVTMKSCRPCSTRTGPRNPRTKSSLPKIHSCSWSTRMTTKRRYNLFLNPKQPFRNGCFNWMIPSLYIGNIHF